MFIIEPLQCNFFFFYAIFGGVTFCIGLMRDYLWLEHKSTIRYHTSSGGTIFLVHFLCFNFS